MLDNSEYSINNWLLPLSFLYGIGVRFRNYLFDNNILTSESFPVPIICVGNLAVGGTGKTPHTEYLIKLLKDNYKVAVLSRGYKRKSSGFVLATEDSDSKDIGDEPFQIKSKFPDVVVAVDANRRRGISKLLDLPMPQRPDVILLDDAFQHRYVKPLVSIVLTDSNRLYHNDALLPAGRLREQKEEAYRADMVIVTKCDENLKPIDYRIMESALGLKAHQQIFFTSVEYGNIKPVFREGKKINPTSINDATAIQVIAGIANPKPFVDEVSKLSGNINVITFPDHHRFDKEDVRKIEKSFASMKGESKILLTTEKDAARLKDLDVLPPEWKECLYYIPINVKFMGRSMFDVEIKKRIKEFINTNKR